MRPSNPSQQPTAPGAILRLRQDLRCSLQEIGGKPFYLIEDLVRGKFFRMGVAEWRMACQLDGQTPLPEAYKRHSHQAGVVAVPPERVQSLCHWLFGAGLATCSTVAAPKPARRPWSVNPFFIKIPLVRPDRWLARLLPLFAWSFSLPAFVAWLLLCATGTYQVVSRLDQFSRASQVYFSSFAWLYLLVAWLLLKVIHEMFHGFACKKFGGFVSECGAVLILFSPVAYVDVTSSWRFRDKWQRIITSAAGMYVEFAAAAVAAIVWSHADAGFTSSICHSVVLSASISTVLFNANPLMRFDGYYLLSDLVEIQNLSILGRRHVTSLAGRWFLGNGGVGFRENGWKLRVVKVYGIAAFCWRILVCASLTIAAGALFHGAGLVIAAFGVVIWVAVPVLRFARLLMGKQKSPPINRRRFAVASGISMVAVVAIAMMPWPGGIRAPAVIAYAPQETVRVTSRGFVEGVHVRAGDLVQVGQLLMTLRGDEIRVELAQIEKELEQSRIRGRVWKQNNEIGAFQAEQYAYAALAEKRDHLAAQVADLEIRSPVDGRVLDRKLETWLGQFVDVGTPLLTIVGEDRKEIQVSIPESHVESFTKFVGQSPCVMIRGDVRPRRLGQLTGVDPRATVTLRNIALGAQNGGPLAVETVAPDENNGPSELDIRLVAPRLHGAIEIPSDSAAALRPGQLAIVSLPGVYESVGRHLFRSVTEWVRGKIALNYG